MQIVKCFQSIEYFLTSRLVARRIEEEDFGKLIQVNSNAKIMEKIGGVRTYSQSWDKLQWNLRQWEENGFGLWMFYLRNSLEWIGYGGIRCITVDNIKETEIAYAIKHKFWGHGLGTEIAKACVEVAFEILRLKNVVAKSHPNNFRSKRIIEKLGFLYEKEIINYGFKQLFYRLKNYIKLEVLPYDKLWFELYGQEERRIKKSLGFLLNDVHHIGSTSIINMPSKPLIDILLECENIEKIDLIFSYLHELGYVYLKRNLVLNHSYFTSKQEQAISYNLHIFETGDPQIKRHINFRDYLLEHPDEASKYAQLKSQLAKRYKEDVQGYISDKSKLDRIIDLNAKLWKKSEKINNLLIQKTINSIKCWTKEKLIKASIANFNIYMTHFAQYMPQVEFIRSVDYTCINTFLPNEYFNCVLDTDFSKNESEDKIKNITQYFMNEKTPFIWWVNQFDKPKALIEILEKYNYKSFESNVSMFADISKSKNVIAFPNRVRIISANSKQSFLLLAEVYQEKEVYKKYFSWLEHIYSKDDPIEFYTVFVNEKLTFSAAICYYAKIAGLYFLSSFSNKTDSEFEKALIHLLFRKAIKLGYHVGALNISNKYIEYYHDLGFKGCVKFNKLKYLGLKI